MKKTFIIFIFFLFTFLITGCKKVDYKELWKNQEIEIVDEITKIETKVETMDINNTNIMVGFLAPKFSQPEDNYALDVLSTMLSSQSSQKN